MRALFCLAFVVTLIPHTAMAQKICIDPGHGGGDSGAAACGLLEKDINLDTSLRLRSLLQGAGYTVIMTRDTDVFIELIDRSAYANAQGADRFTSIHANAFDGTVSGIETFAHTSAGSTSLDLRDKIQE